MVSLREAESRPEVTCMVYFEVSMTCSEIYTKHVGLLKTLLLSSVASSGGLKS